MLTGHGNDYIIIDMNLSVLDSEWSVEPIGFIMICFFIFYFFWIFLGAINFVRNYCLVTL